ncbi:uncharacterized protein LOC120346349 isoform X2 [Styela clava]
MVSKLVAERYSHGLTKTRGLYDIADAENEQWEARRQQLNSLGALSLFTQQEDAVEEKTPKLQFDSVRPITPINDSIKSAPKTYPSFSKLIYRRINPRPEWNHISKEDQSSLGAVIMGEVNAIWPVLRRQVSDPFLTHQQNKELQRRITVHCVTVCEQLFIHYADKVKILNSRGVFSNPANLSRIRAQLALDAGKYLNILSIRRHIISDLKKPSTKEVITYNRDEVIAPSPVTPMTTESPKQELSFRDLVKSSRPRRKMKYQFNLKAEINSMQSQMPTISRSKIHQLQPLAKQEPFIYADEQEDESNMEDDSDMIESARREEKDLEIDDDHISVSSYPIILEHRCPSEPLGQHTLLIEELRQRQEEEDEIIMKSPSTILPSRQRIHSVTPIVPLEHQQKCRTSLGLERVLHDDSRDVDSLDPKEDLRLLMERQERERKKERESQERTPTDPSTHIPPLIQALTRREAQDEKVRKLKIKEKELDMKYKEELEEKMKPLPEPQYPQPAVVQTKLPGVSNPVDRTAITIRASDVKLNDHVDLSTVTLGSYQPVYNDLKGDISQATVKELDANLFQGGELKEVYSEIMKTVPNIHQHYDNDPLIVTPGTNVDLSQILASSTLVRPSSQQVINPKLRRYEFDMPWQGQQMMWMKSTTHPQSGYPESDASSMTQAHGECVMPFHRFTPSQLNHPGVEKGSRAYASWLQWWKNTINTDDFFKYLSTQDTDFLSVLFHFYDSDAADSETESMRTAKMDAQKERDKKLTALKKEKEEFVAGLWNVKAVTLGGLGKDPEMEEEEFSDFGTPRLSDRSQSISQLGSRSMRDSGTPRSTRSRARTRDEKLISKVMFANQLKNEYSRKTAFPQHTNSNALQASSSSSFGETLSTESASFGFPRKFGIGSDQASSDSNFDYSTSNSSVSCGTLETAESLYTTLKELHDGSDLTDSDSTLVPSTGVRKTKKKHQMPPARSAMFENLLKILPIQLHDKFAAYGSGNIKFSDMSLGNETDTTETTIDCVSESISSSSNDLVDKCDELQQCEYDKEIDNDKIIGDSSGLPQSGTSTTGEESTSGYFSTSGGHMNNIVEELIEEQLETEEDIMSKESCSEDDIKDNENQKKCEILDMGYETHTEGYKRKKTLNRSLLRTEKPVTTTEFLTRLNAYSHMTKLIAENCQNRSESMHKGTTVSSKSHADSREVSTPSLTIQERLEIVWQKLKMPDSQKLNFALKYSSDKYIKKLPEIVRSWERVTDFILQREKLMTNLEVFEKEASDPNRFFERGHRGSSAMRLDEAKMRANLHRKLEAVESTIKSCLISLKSRFSDTVTYNGRPYLEKMGWDKIEMLYFLQQERRCTMLKDHGHPEQLDLFLHVNQQTTPNILPPSGRRYIKLPLKSVKLTGP